jgi:succinate dehydrogenase/fumarate reductase flavoprotein subunit
MGGVRVDENMRTRIEGLYAAGEAVAGANGANRLSGNAITEALVFGNRAGIAAARWSLAAKSDVWTPKKAAPALERIQNVRTRSSLDAVSPAALQRELQYIMWEQVGPFRNDAGLTEAESRLAEIAHTPTLLHRDTDFNLDIQDQLELRAMVATAQTVVMAARARRESRGAHQRLDFPDTTKEFQRNQIQTLKGDRLHTTWVQGVGGKG